MPLNLIYQDTDLVIIDKPSGLLVHRSKLDAQNTEFAVQQLRDQIGQEVFPCHRLDRPTSGLLVFALNRATLRTVAQQFAEGRVWKSYLAIVRGWPNADGIIDYPLRQEEPPHKIQEAQTHYTTLKCSELPVPVGRYATARVALLELQPQSGRTHQLRRHLAHIRHPILGDTRHGDGAQNRFMRETAKCNRLLLRATQLRFTLPNGVEQHIEAPLEEDFEEARNRLRL
ncbi:pseudouridine synthase [Coraliomargarita akajimensis]|uniref:tRNA pseudouridine synthase C n=1 Tax=Coraliomargarita akajimensis (strain DSM 45221 / IAM 15411 / JCM 23193 / KCTC 12865 / 04OKA010-24) TaxID=583355 RepID=D5EJ36_CORAD|nr:pseudouridine synthase [Coraliomargarita akajimensis]ADE54435.1 pseudouridine synthase [Coraliomargarita akajimensis DSM 45221]